MNISKIGAKPYSTQVSTQRANNKQNTSFGSIGIGYERTAGEIMSLIRSLGLEGNNYRDIVNHPLSVGAYSLPDCAKLMHEKGLQDVILSDTELQKLRTMQDCLTRKIVKYHRNDKTINYEQLIKRSGICKLVKSYVENAQTVPEEIVSKHAAKLEEARQQIKSSIGLA